MQFNGKLLSITSQVDVHLEAKREDLGFEGLPATYIFWSPSYRCYYLTFSFLLPINKLVLDIHVKGNSSSYKSCYIFLFIFLKSCFCTFFFVTYSKRLLKYFCPYWRHFNLLFKLPLLTATRRNKAKKKHKHFNGSFFL